jgi:hypothetical protein
VSCWWSGASRTAAGVGEARVVSPTAQTIFDLRFYCWLFVASVLFAIDGGVLEAELDENRATVDTALRGGGVP